MPVSQWSNERPVRQAAGSTGPPAGVEGDTRALQGQEGNILIIWGTPAVAELAVVVGGGAGCEVLCCSVVFLVILLVLDTIATVGLDLDDRLTTDNNYTICFVQ